MSKLLFSLLFLFAMVHSENLNSEVAQPNKSLSKCQQQCNQNEECLKNCQKLKQEAAKNMVIITLCMISFCLIVCGCCLLWSHPKFRKLRLYFNKEYKLMRMNTQIDKKIMSKDEFNCHYNSIVQLFNQSTKHDNFRSYKSGFQIISHVEITTVQVTSFLHEIQLKGEDDVGTWVGSGAITCTHEGVICWFIKQYNQVYWKDKQNKGKFLYQSKPSNLQGLQGIWYNLEKSQTQSQNQWKLMQIKSGLHEDSDHKICE